jgi:hypothetical protein
MSITSKKISSGKQAGRRQTGKRKPGATAKNIGLDEKNAEANFLIKILINPEVLK